MSPKPLPLIHPTNQTGTGRTRQAPFVIVVAIGRPAGQRPTTHVIRTAARAFGVRNVSNNTHRHTRDRVCPACARARHIHRPCHRAANSTPLPPVIADRAGTAHSLSLSRSQHTTEHSGLEHKKSPHHRGRSVAPPQGGDADLTPSMTSCRTKRRVGHRKVLHNSNGSTQKKASCGPSLNVWSNVGKQLTHTNGVHTDCACCGGEARGSVRVCVRWRVRAYVATFSATPHAHNTTTLLQTHTHRATIRAMRAGATHMRESFYGLLWPQFPRGLYVNTTLSPHALWTRSRQHHHHHHRLGKNHKLTKPAAR